MRRIDYTTEWVTNNIWAKGVQTWNWWYPEYPISYWCIYCDGELPLINSRDDIAKMIPMTGEIDDILKHIKTEEHQQQLLLAKLGGEKTHGY